VSSLKKHLEPDGVFANFNLTNLNHQKQVISNYFQAIKYDYNKIDMWNNSNKNPFLRSAGFKGAIDALTTTFLPRCADKKSFKFDTFSSILGLDSSSLLYQNEIKDLGGTSASKRVKEYLEYNLLQSIPDQEEYEFPSSMTP
jgi:hypothetical protein